MNACPAEDKPAHIEDLRALLHVRFPGSTQPLSHSEQDHRPDSAGGGSPRNVLQTGIADWDSRAGGLRLGEVAEICGRLGASGLVMDALIQAASESGRLGAWVDAGDCLEVEAWQPAWLERMVWVRCQDPLTALKAADLLLRDGNLSWVTLDLQGTAPASLRRISAQHWHRFHRLVRHQGNTLLVLTPSPMVEGVKVRLAASQTATLESLDLPRTLLRGDLRAQVFVRGQQPGVPVADPEGFQKIA